jgi:hypothetical protein
MLEEKGLKAALQPKASHGGADRLPKHEHNWNKLSGYIKPGPACYRLLKSS